jgi:NADP-dependent 3-hydroxy acid dehydrogenase YdfG
MEQDINIKGVQNMIRAFVPKMVEAKTGVIVNFSSGLGHSTNPLFGAYCG